MSKKLTDEQLRDWRDFRLAGAGPRAMAAELLALRALLREAGETLEHVAKITGLDHPSMRIRIAKELGDVR